ncbi:MULTISPECIES: relaxase/mobilization nuclease domain-containing protein [unclassified Dehalobacter]|jgi:Relaxase/Mobilisation nuclease domain.|uniref:relaxase/mobilization nuclease domain-containing protein n=1 Tax=unclassified Dehalobacter TaxID=2635733 RepID=UPI00028BC0BF|nr:MULTISPECIES: relaxase/mobilization nuclease domain-containing protein [unclassified Dehalobacter]AFV01114.1 Relaxase [Dehalobacter sp. DCA]AFV04157.1 Relaxase [Dehalobacter sp. CF]
MAATAIWDVTDRLDRVINYAANPNKTENLDFASPNFQSLLNVLEYTARDDKTEKQFYVDGINCDPAIAYVQMSQTKLQFQKTDGILAFHGYQSFAPGEASPETAHAIGVKLAQELWGGRFEVIVSTHLDKNHLHNHFVLNSVSFADGMRYYDNKATYALMRQASDRLCREYSLSVIENPQEGKSKHYAEWEAEKEGKPTWRGLIREDVDEAISASMTFSQFISTLRNQGYEVKTGVKYIAVRPQGKERFVRLKTIGEDYTEEIIKQRILKNRTPKRQEVLPEPKRKRYIARSRPNPKKARKLKGLRALYFHYLYKMGILPKQSASNKRTHFLLREDIRHMEELTAQTKLLCIHRIENKEQLSTHQSKLEQEMTALSGDRKSLYHRLRRCKDDSQVADCKQQIAGLSKKLSLLGKEVKLCTGILSRSEVMKKKLSRISLEENELRREEKEYEQRSRRSRPNRQYES